MTSRNIKDLVPELQDIYEKFANALQDAGLEFIVTCTYRDQAEQDVLYAKGRTKPGPKVTWVKHSKHQDRKAFDIAIIRNRKPVWDIKADTNNNGIPDYDEAGQIGESLGLRWGGGFSSPDRPHFELTEN